jgi:DNA-binding transcriptional regulator YdaS (Cro superfamily)
MKTLLMGAFASAPRGTQARVADALDLPPTTVNKWAKGYNLPEPHRWPEVERLLGLTDGALAEAAGITQPQESPVVALADLLHRLDAAVTRLEDRVQALERPADPRPAPRGRADSARERSATRAK